MTPQPRHIDYLRTLGESGAMTEAQLAGRMGVDVLGVRQQLASGVQTGAVLRERRPDDSVMLGITDTGRQLVAREDELLDVLDELRVVGPTSPFDLSAKFGLDRETTGGVLAECAQLSWITGYDRADPTGAVFITNRGVRKLDAAVARGAR